MLSFQAQDRVRKAGKPRSASTWFFMALLLAGAPGSPEMPPEIAPMRKSY
jgi:hypothetical protein